MIKLTQNNEGGPDKRNFSEFDINNTTDKGGKLYFSPSPIMVL